MANPTQDSRNARAVPKPLAEAIAEMLTALGELPSQPDEVVTSLAKGATHLRKTSGQLAARFADRYFPGIADAIADEADRLARSIDAAMDGGGEARDRLVASAGIVDAGTGLSRALVALGGSYRDAREGGASSPNAEEIRAVAGATAFALYEAAMHVGQAAGFPAIEPVAFSWPRAKACGCRARERASEAPGVARAYRTGPGLVPPVYDPDAMEKALRRLIAALVTLFALLALLARFHHAILAYFDEYYYQACSDDCTGPSGKIISIKMTRSYASADGTATPMADGETELCCSNPCMGFLTEWDVEVVPIAGVKAGAAFGVGREVAAAAFAATNGAAAIRRAVLAAPPACPP